MSLRTCRLVVLHKSVFVDSSLPARARTPADDPTKWFIIVMHWLGLASQLKTFPDNEIRRGQYAMKLKAVAKEADEIRWPKDSNHLPVLTWDEFQEACKTRQLMVISGYIHDVSTFIDEHPGGRALIKTRLGVTRPTPSTAATVRLSSSFVPPCESTD